MLNQQNNKVLVRCVSKIKLSGRKIFKISKTQQNSTYAKATNTEGKKGFVKEERNNISL